MRRALPLLAALLLAACSRSESPPLGLNDLHLKWLLDGKDFFVPDDGGLRPHPELRRLDNGDAAFSARKDPGAVRVFCVGGSTTRGWPFHERVSYPALLALYLRDLLPGRRVEVINAGFMASDSASDEPLVRELLGYDADVLLLYEGRNDLGNAPLRAGPRGALVRLRSRLARRWPFFRQRDGFDRAEAAARWASPEDADAREAVGRVQLSRQMPRLTALARERGCAVLWLTQVAAHAEPEGIALVNELLRGLARREAVPLVDVEAEFARAKTPRSELMLSGPSPHPDLAGYALMARAVAGALARTGLIAPPREWRWGRLKGDDAYLAELGAEPRFLASRFRGLSDLCFRLGQLEAAARCVRRAEAYEDGVRRKKPYSRPSMTARASGASR